MSNQEAAVGTRRKRNPNQKSPAWLFEAHRALGWLAILALIALLGAIYLAQASRIATVGRQVQSLQFQLDEVRRQNAALELEIAEAQSVERLRTRAVELGFVPVDPAATEYIVVDGYPAQADTAVETPPDELSEPIESGLEALWIAITRTTAGMVRGESQ